MSVQFQPIHCLFFLFFISQSILSKAQNAALQYSLSLARSKHYFSDRALSADRFAGEANSIQIATRSLLHNKLSILKVGFESGRYSGTMGNINARSAQLQIIKGYNTINGNIKGYTGFGINFSPSYAFSTDKIQNTFSWNSANHLSLYQHVLLPLKKALIEMSVNIPLIGGIYQTNEEYEARYGKDINKLLMSIYQNQKLATIDIYQGIEASVQYHFLSAKKLGVAVGFEYDYKKIRKNCYSDEAFQVSLALSFR